MSLLADKRALVMGLTLIVLSLIVLQDMAAQMVSTTYGLKPAAMPYVVTTALAALGVRHIVVAFRDGLPVPEHAYGVAIGWIAVGLMALLLCIACGAGFVLVTTILFAATARAFGRRGGNAVRVWLLRAADAALGLSGGTPR
jgi:putative tricarboxylic transport membrane protein